MGAARTPATLSAAVPGPPSGLGETGQAGSRAGQGTRVAVASDTVPARTARAGAGPPGPASTSRLRLAVPHRELTSQPRSGCAASGPTARRTLRAVHHVILGTRPAYTPPPTHTHYRHHQVTQTPAAPPSAPPNLITMTTGLRATPTTLRRGNQASAQIPSSKSPRTRSY